MIAVKALIGKLNFISFSDERLVDQSLAQIDLAKERCPACGAVGRCSSIDGYPRMMITVVAGTRKEVELQIPRVRCDSCQHTHALLPDVLIPHGSYTLRFILFVLNAYIDRTEPVAKLCERWAISISTLYSWIHLFQEQYNLWVRILEQISWVTQAALAIISDIPSFPSLFLTQFKFPFLHRKETARFRPNGRGGGLYFPAPHNSEIDL